MSSDPNDRSTSSPDHAAEPPKPAADSASEPAPAAGRQGSDDAPPTAEPTGEPSAADAPSPEAAEAGGPPPESENAQDSETPGRPRRRVLIGSQRDAAAYRPKPNWDSIRIVGKKPRRSEEAEQTKPKEEQAKPAASVARPAETDEERTPATSQAPAPPSVAPEPPSAQADAPPRVPPESAEAEVPPPGPAAVSPATPAPAAETPEPALDADVPEVPAEDEAAAVEVMGETAPPPPKGGKRFPPPNIRDRLPADLEAELEQALADQPLDELMSSGEEVTKQVTFEADSKHAGRVVMVRREDVFVELGGREQGIVPLKQFEEPPEVGAEVQVRVVRFNREEGIYELARSGAAASVADWADLEEGMLVEARVTGHNTGGLECDVNHIRGFIPASQIALYHVEHLEEFVDQKLTCLVTEANPRRRNLVLSRRALLEREREEARRALLESLEPGQVREGVVRKLVDFGAFVDLGGVDGLLHISQLSWGRVKHPSDVLHEGQHLQVKIEKVDEQTGKIGLAYRDLLESPWTDVEKKYPVTSTVHGKVTKLMEFGAFVELEPGVEGLVHVSQLSHKRVWRVSDVVKEGDEVDAVVLSVDEEAQRISLSMKELIEEPKAAKEEKPSEADEPPPPSKRRKQRDKPLQGGLGRSSGGEKFGLRW